MATIHIVCTMMSLILQEVVEDLSGDPEENSSHYMSILIEALSILGKIEETLNVCVLSITELVYSWIYSLSLHYRPLIIGCRENLS